MRLLSTLLLAAAAFSAQAAGTLETLKSGSGALFSTLSVPPRFVPGQRAAEPQPGAPKAAREPILQDPRLSPLRPSEAPGPVVGRVALPAQLDRHRDLLTRALGPSSWEIGLAQDAAFGSFYMTFRQGPRLTVAPLGELTRLRGEGVEVAVEPGVIYKVRVAVNIFSPVRGSTLKLEPARGTRGPKHEIKTGAVLDAAKARATVFHADGIEYWAFYGTDIDPKTVAPAETRSFLFVHFDGLDSKAWPVADGALPDGEWVSAQFGAKRFLLGRAGAELIVRKAR